MSYAATDAPDRTRFSAIPCPILPRPMNPTLCIAVSCPATGAVVLHPHLVENLLRGAEAAQTRGHAYIHRDLKQDLLNLLLRKSVRDAHLDVPGEFVWAV